jgi:archaellum component FlaC
MKKLLIGCLSVWLGMAVCGFAEEQTAACDADTMSQVLKRLDAIEKRLDSIEDRFGKYLPANESMFNIYDDVKKLKTEVREINRGVDRVSKDLRRLETRR